MISIEVSGINTAEKHLKEIPQKIATEVIRKMSQIIYESAQKGSDKHTKTGALKQSLYNRPIPNGREIGHDPQRAPYAKFVHWGTKPHLIKPKNRKVLRWSAGGIFHFSKIVHHPGYKGDPWLTRAALEAIRDFDKIVQNALKGL